MPIESVQSSENAFPQTTKQSFRVLLKIALPVMLGSTIETLYNLTDAFFLGKLGTAEISAPSISFNIIFFLLIFGIGLSGAGTTLIAQSKGRGDLNKMNHYLNQMASILISISVILGVFGFLISGTILKLLNTPVDVYPLAKKYMEIVFIGTPFSFTYLILQSAYTAVGDTKVPIIVHLSAVVLNVVLDPLFIFGFKSIKGFGVRGAAYATIFSQAVCAILSVIVLLKPKHGLCLNKSAFHPNLKSWSLFLKIGLPSSFGQGVSAFGFTVLQGVVNSFGTSAIAAFGVGNRITSMFDIPLQGIANGTTSLVGRAIGAKDEKAANKFVKTAIIMVLVFEIPLLVLSTIFGGELVKLFVNDSVAIELGSIMFKVVNPSLLAFGVYMALTGAFQGAGDTKIIMILAIFRLWGVRVPMAYALMKYTNLGPILIWIAMFFSNSLTAIVGFIYYKKGKWKKASEKF